MRKKNNDTLPATATTRVVYRQITSIHFLKWPNVRKYWLFEHLR